MTVRFQLGQVVATPGALEALEQAQIGAAEFLNRHQSGDFGEVDEEDRAENEASIRQGYRVLSAYTLRTGTKIWIVTEADRSSTTILLPEEY